VVKRKKNDLITETQRGWAATKKAGITTKGTKSTKFKKVL
jgi:hypothetical protein